MLRKILPVLAVFAVVSCFTSSLQAVSLDWGTAGDSSLSFEWVREYGEASSSVGGRGLAVSQSGNIYVSGDTNTSSQPSLKDIFLGSFDANGNLNWLDSQVSNTGDTNNAISADSNGNVYITTSTKGDLGGPNQGADDVILKKYNGSGSLQWARQFGSSSQDFGMSVTVDQLGSVFVTGYTLGELGDYSANGWDGYLAKFDSSGNQQWTKQIGSDRDDYGTSVTADGFGNVYVTGITNGSVGSSNFGEEDVFVRKYDGLGALLWTNQFGTAGVDFPGNTTIDGSGNLLLTGTTEGNLGGSYFGGSDAFISKIDTQGNMLWSRQLGTTSDEEGSGIAIDESGTIYIGGYTRGSLATQSFGSRDAFLARYNESGDIIDVHQFGTPSSDSVWGVGLDNAGNLYVSGTSSGGISGDPSVSGNPNAFLAKIQIIPEPTSCTLALAAICFAMSRRRIADR